VLWYSGLYKDVAKEPSGPDGGDDVRPPLPVIREALYDDAVLYGWVFVSLFSSVDYLVPSNMLSLCFFH